VFQRLAQVMGKPELLADPRFATPVARSDNDDEMDALVDEWTRSLPMTELERLLDGAGVPASRIFNLEDIFADPHYRARNMLVEPEDRELGPVAMANVVPRMSRTPGAVRWSGRDIGQDTVQVLADELGLSPEQITELSEAQVIYSAGAFTPTRAVEA